MKVWVLPAFSENDWIDLKHHKTVVTCITSTIINQDNIKCIIGQLKSQECNSITLGMKHTALIVLQGK